MTDMVTREQLENQLEIMVSQKPGLLATLENSAANVHANDGAIQTLQYLLSTLNGAGQPTAPIEEGDENEV